MLVREPLRRRSVRIARHAHQNHVGGVSRDATETTSDARRERHFPCWELLARVEGRRKALLERVVDSEPRERVGHLAEDRGGETGVGAATDAC